MPINTKKLWLITACTGFFFLKNTAWSQSNCYGLALKTCPSPEDRTVPDVKDMLTWDQKQRVVGFRNDYRSYEGDVFRAGRAYPIPRSPRSLDGISYRYKRHDYRLSDYLHRNSVTGMMVIKDGKTVWEYYGQGNTPTTLWTSRSVGKSVVSTLIGIALKQGKIKSLDDAIVKYNPDVRGTVWENVTLRQLLQHSSGVAWNEDYTKPGSDFARLTQCEAGADAYECVRKLVEDPARQSYAPAGSSWSYSSGGAWLLGDTLEKATGKSLSQNLQEMIWQPYGMTQDGVWHSYLKGKHDVGAHGFNATLEDWGKFGLFVLNNGVLPDGRKMLPDHWMEEARHWVRARNSVSASHPEGIYGYQWWNNSVPSGTRDAAPLHGLEYENSQWAIGIFGQFIAVDQKENLVIVQWSTWPEAEPSFDTRPLETSLMFNAIANFLR